MSSQEKTNHDVLRARGRCTGALIFTIFGGCWFLLSAAYFHRFHFIVTTPIVVALCLLSFAAWQLQRSQPPAVSEGSFGARKQADDRVFMIINAVTYSAVLLLFLILPRFGLQNYIFPGFVALVGLHFFPMPPLYRYTANFITGSAMIVWAAICVTMFRADGNREAAYVALGAGTALWASAVWAILTARRLFKTRSTVLQAS